MFPWGKNAGNMAHGPIIDLRIQGLVGIFEEMVV
jgi:hypothetical protein